MQLSDELRRPAPVAPPRGRVRVVMDTDTYNEIDDQFAIVQMMLSPQRLNVEAIYAARSTINVPPVRATAWNRAMTRSCACCSASTSSPKGLVYRGVGEYVGPDKVARDADAVDDLIARARAGSPDDPLYVIAIAAISDVASAILKAPDIIDRVVVVWLGGHVLEWPHTREFNLKQDVGGAQVLFDSGVPLVMVPCMGVTSHLHSTVPEIERYIEPHGDIGAFLAMRFKEYSDDHKGWSKQIWDMAAVGWVLNPDWAPSVMVSAPILTDQVTWSTDHGRHPIRYVRQIDRDGIMRDFIEKLEEFAS